MELSITEEPYSHSHDANIIMYDITNKDSFINLTQTVEYIQTKFPAERMPVMLILGNKLDLEKKRAVEADIVKSFALEKNTKYLECSVHLNINIEDVLYTVAQGILNHRSKGLKSKKKSKQHEAKIQRLKNPETDNIRKIGDVVSVCCEKEFLIGTGCGGTCVYVGLHDDGSEVAVKRILTHVHEACLKGNEMEIGNLVELKKSDHIVNYRCFIPGNPFCYIVLDLCEETLADYVQRHNEEELAILGPVIIREILIGLSALHCGVKKVLHMDLKPCNILVDVEGHMRLADFGVSRILEGSQTELRTGPKGTPGWRAAESIAETEGTMVTFKRKSDIQVVGMICFYILTKGDHPFGRPADRLSNIARGRPVHLDRLSDPNARRFVSLLINQNIDERPYVDDALHDPYLPQALDQGVHLS